ncbi:uncharacterized protein PHACADRAFT_248243 [Phanerochaete carnosa HHB-10118-sp]|uniref:Uncharacterized protein n=1 Tax=Phanerochaete carnosa (strain HHB-10118-sp) TaxID=650164 RepID=K5VEV5_PHACS|nr:uncharacterized protein PHACADRAFT_248243 [Phanerochaete carnosa HHB-10118-sp]EKM61561.1 hypothetical protein PHACADRAFT_248243 [Phanerochaete carnosa HHB-10118-sp]
MGHQRHRSFVSYFNKAMHPLHDTSADSSPRRSSMSSFATRSDASSSSASSYYSYSLLSASPSSRSPILSERSTNRTQPYSAPYYAAMPTPQPRRSSSARKVVEIRQPISEGEEPLEERTQSSLSGLEAGSLARGRAVAGDCVSDTEVAHKRRYRFIDDGRDQAR